MADPKGFLKYNRATPETRKVDERVLDYKEIYQPVDETFIKDQSSRCMDCGVPFCHSGCPLGNLIPDFNDAVYKEEWEKAYHILSETNNFPEFTGRICPAPCESACVLGINNLPVTIENIEKQIIEHAFAHGWVRANNLGLESGKNIAVIGSGPAGLAAAAQLNKAGHRVSVYDRNDKPGGLLRYGIPDFKLEKWVVDRRVDAMKEAGITFICQANVGFNIDIKDIEASHDAIVLCGGSTIPRDLNIPGREASGVHFAMDFLEKSNKYVDGGLKTIPAIHVKDKKVIVIGGGDTGADCVGTSNRQSAASVTQIELLAKPGHNRTDKDPWPLWPMVLRTSSSHEEGCQREWSIQTKRFIKNETGVLTGIELVDIEWKMDESTGRYDFVDVAGTTRIMECDYVFIAAGFLHPQKEGIIDQLGIELDNRGNVSTKSYQTNLPHVFAAGDMRRGQSLVVWAIQEGREAARAVDQYLMGVTKLEGKVVNELVMG
ncbi:MAG: glutamate synthase subunit beta [Saprospiraceae bacterium]|nr:glutamate synthase subunit beta [Saprospiraceae bacterium]MBP6568397.1 glutamate synthase subunit beta [Saprospiraceae bacterium]